MKQTCEYCKWFYQSQFIRKQDVTTRICNHVLKIGGKLKLRLLKKEVTLDSQACKNFHPVKFFFCDNYDQWIIPRNCVWRKVDLHKAYENCKNCRQFEKHVSGLIEKRVDLKKKRKIKFMLIEVPVTSLKKKRLKSPVKTLQKRRAR